MNTWRENYLIRIEQVVTGWTVETQWSLPQRIVLLEAWQRVHIVAARV